VFTGGLQGAEGGFWNRIRAGFAAVAGARAQAKADQEAQEAEEARAAKEKEEQEKAQVKAAKAAAKTPTPGGEQAGAPVPAGTTTQQEDVMTGMSGIGGDLENVSDLRGETTRVQSVLDDIADQVAEVSSWAVNLGDRINEAPFETAALITQAAEIAEALAGLRGLDDASDVLTGMDGALKEAEALGEHADEVAAGGNVGAFRAS
jgi:predicted flap endonuclease-1-like 5' DNA nuclease